MVITTETLIDAIRSATTLNELKRLVGPSEQQIEESKQRLRAINDLYSKAEQEGWGYDRERWPQVYLEQYDSLIEAHVEYSNTYARRS